MSQILKSILATVAILISLCSVGQTMTFAQSTEEKTRAVRVEYQPETIQKAQQALKDKGFYKGQVTGKMDAATREAIKSFQQQQGLKPTGRLNKDTRQALGIELVATQPAKKTSK
ncbi:MAG: peptidoglycan-binding domain-containing protein [Acidobacteriota bacterium]|nr:peptidoglycan-binding protein [Blastocatellia bacterium]MDW8412605.1 peptidoglycan-binding domain-containing protein [Acidobacteriota bacterium]